jgi:hypothetical protein
LRPKQGRLLLLKVREVSPYLFDALAVLFGVTEVEKVGLAAVPDFQPDPECGTGFATVTFPRQARREQTPEV